MPALTDIHSASRRPGLSSAFENHSVEKSSIGHVGMRAALKAYIPMMIRGIHRKASASATKARRAQTVGVGSRITGCRTLPAAGR